MVNDRKSVGDASAYIVKYINKDVKDKKLIGKKSYFTSKTLKRPEIIYEDIYLRAYFDKYNLSDDYQVYHNSYMCKEKGSVLYYESGRRRNIQIDNLL